MTTSPEAVEKICRTDDAVLEAKQPQHQSRGCQWSCPARRPVWSLLLPAVLGPGLRRYATNTAGNFPSYKKEVYGDCPKVKDKEPGDVLVIGDYELEPNQRTHLPLVRLGFFVFRYSTTADLGQSAMCLSQL